MLFDRENDDFGSDIATRALSVTAVETDFVARVYEKQASWYERIRTTVSPGQRRARRRIPAAAM